MGILLAFLLFLASFLGAGKPIISKEGNITTIIIKGQVYKSAESKILEAWTSLK